MSKFEKKFGKFAIKNLSLYLIICYAFGYAITLINPQIMNYLILDPYKIIFEGNIWRLFTWILVPPGQFSIWILITLFFYYSIGTNLERVWGTYKYNVYIFTGFLYTILGSFLYVLIGVLQYLPELASMNNAFTVIKDLSEVYGLLASMQISTYYINMSTLLLFAFTFPDVQVLLMFIIPIKVKWIGIAYAVLLGYEVVVGMIGRNYPAVVMIVMSLLNFILFFVKHKRRVKITPKQAKQRVVYRANMHRAGSGYRHKCAICGRTEADSDELEFRYCSKCQGNYEYCQDHLFTHTHVK